MMQGINLLPQEIQKEREAADRAVLINAVSVAALVVLGSLVLVLFSYRVYLSRQVNDLDDQLSTVTSQIQEKRTLEGKLQSLHGKLDVLGEVFAARSPYPAVLTDLQAAFDGRGGIGSVTLENEKAVQVSAKANSLSGLADVLASLEKAGYQNLTMTSVKFDGEEGVFRVELGFKVSEKISSSKEQ